MRRAVPLLPELHQARLMTQQSSGTLRGTHVRGETQLITLSDSVQMRVQCPGSAVDQTEPSGMLTQCVMG